MSDANFAVGEFDAIVARVGSSAEMRTLLDYIMLDKGSWHHHAPEGVRPLQELGRLGLVEPVKREAGPECWVVTARGKAVWGYFHPPVDAAYFYPPNPGEWGV